MSGTGQKVPDKLGKYDLRGTLGRGAMGTVYDGWDPAIARRVAIKTVRLADADDEETAEALGRFKREAQAAGRLSHPNIVGVYDYGETDQIAYIVMEFVEGRSLKAVIDQQKRVPPEEAAQVMGQVLAGLAYSHARGVIHRDIKPANIMLTTEGQVKIADFGIARIESSSMTSVGTVMGTPAYMPPEQFLGEPVDARSDIYAAGVMLFHMLTGERPYEGSMTSIMHKVLNAEAPPRPSARPGVSRMFDSAVAMAMARAPENRFSNAGDFAFAVKAALANGAAPIEDDDDATMVVSRPAARPAKDPTLAPKAPVKPAAAAGVAKQKNGPPMALIGGGVLVLLLAAGGGYFALRPGLTPSVTPAQQTLPAVTASPPPAPTPQTTTPETARAQQAPTLPAAPPAPDPQAMRQAVTKALAALPCSALTLSGDSISGLMGSGNATEAAHKAVADAAPGLQIAWDADSVPAAECGALDVARIADAGNETDKLAMTIGSAARLTQLKDGGHIMARVTLPDHPAWLTLDYLSNDTSQRHLYPGFGISQHVLKPHATVALKGVEGEIAPPYGRDLVLGLASSEKLLALPRSDSETSAEYYDALANAVRAAKERGVSMSAAIVLIDTAKK